MSELGALLSDTVTRLFGDLVTDEVLQTAEQGAWPDRLWRALAEQGLTLALVPEPAGGAGASWADAYVVARAAGYHTAPVPLVETMLAAWLAAGAGLPVPPGPLSVAPVRGEALRLARAGAAVVVHGVAARVPWARTASHVVVVGDLDGRSTVALVPTASAAVASGENLAREPRDTVTFDGARAEQAGPAGSGLLADAVLRYGALVRSAQMAGALARALDEAVKHVGVRIQFGRPLARFQAIQQQLAVLGEHVAAAGVAAECAFRAADRGDAGFEVAVAKVRAGEAAGIGAGIAHQVHGAIGFTYEHHLHFATRRLWSWRSEFGSEARWSEELGRAAARIGADGLWSHVTSR
ncbi:MAG TPA: acyl-CoA dehydrogenase family protein [Candidatus Binatia bacterium]|nr:acyl-CoA dehydrogenase family protein [Candidatus Binatia bacterium]